MKKFKKIYVHIGLGKTGTTTIQNFLFNNRLQLLKQNIVVPVFPINEINKSCNHSRPIKFIFSDFEFPKAIIEKLTGTDKVKNMTAHKNKYRDLLFEHLDNNEGNSELLISGEGICNLDIAGLQKFKDALYKHSDIVEFVAFIRHPKHAISSLVQQYVKSGLDLQEIYKNLPIDYSSKRIKKLLKVFDIKQVKLFDFYSIAKSNIISEFLRIFEISSNNLKHRKGSKKENTSLSKEAVILINALNKLKHLDSKIKYGQIRKMLFDLPGDKFFIPREVYDLNREREEKELIWFKETFNLFLKSPEVVFDTTMHDFNPEALGELLIYFSKTKSY